MSSLPSPITHRPPTYQTGLAWLVILGLVVFTIWIQQAGGERLRESGDELLALVQGRMILALNEFDQQKRAGEELDRLKKGPYGQRLLVTILVGELDGRDGARQYLADLEALRIEHQAALNPADERLRDVLERLYAADPRPELTEEDQETLAKYGWLGQLARAHRPGADPTEVQAIRAEAVRAMGIAFGMMLLGGLLAIVGLGLLIVFFIQWMDGQIPWALEPQTGSGLYAETFAVWLGSYLALARLLAIVPGLSSLVSGGLAMLLSAGLALLWGRLRGRDWHTIRADLGLQPGRSVGQEMLVGLATYATILPLILASVVVVGFLSDLVKSGPGGENPFAPSGRPTHPIVRLILGPGWMVISIFITAAVIAPLVEELAFRGMLQRHLRGFLGRLTSAFAVGLVFAIIHPQGLLGVPALLAIAVPLSLAREWRGSLIASMTAHALNNAAVTTLLLVMTR